MSNENLNIEISDKVFDISIDGHCTSTWGGITGDINNQTDLISLLDVKQDVIPFDLDYRCYLI